MSRPKDFATWSAAKQEKWREEKRKIARKSYAKHAEERKRKVRLYKARVRGTVLVEGDCAKKRTRRPEMRQCRGSRCYNIMEYNVWIGRDKVCKSCKAKALHKEKEREQLRRRFYKLVAASGRYGNLSLQVVNVRSDLYCRAADLHCVEILSGDEFWGTARAYVRTTDKNPCGRPELNYCRDIDFRDTWEAWFHHAFMARRAGEAAYARGALDRFNVKHNNRIKQRRASKAREARLKREAEKAEKRKAALESARKAALRLAKKKEKARRKRLEAARLAGLRRGKLSKELPFFQMMAGAESIARYIKQQTTNNHEHDSDSEIR